VLSGSGPFESPPKEVLPAFKEGQAKFQGPCVGRTLGWISVVSEP
jgi:hypothetical protein